MAVDEVLFWLERAVAVGLMARYAWFMRRGFTRPDGLTPRVAFAAFASTMAGVWSMVALFAFNDRDRGFNLAGTALYVLAWLLFEWAVKATRERRLSFAFSSDWPVRLMNRGPYRLVRHPFYTSYMLAWIATLVATRQPLLLGLILGMFVFYNRAANYEESKFAASPLADDYASYRARTGKFLPLGWMKAG
jgi:protein-S-isoprenylcysteine O-methyltransferase Ste14